MNCLYYNPELDQYWVIDYRLYDKTRDGKTKLDHMEDMLNMVDYRDISYTTVLMDTWYATSEMMMLIHKKEKTFFCPIKSNRKTDDKLQFDEGKFQHQAAHSLQWTQEELVHGKTVNLKGLDLTLKLFQIVLATGKTELIVTNDLTQNSTDDCQKETAIRWKIEQFHREEKQVTGIGKCECRINRSQRNHISIAMLVWVRLKEIASRLKITIYQVKERLLQNYMIQQMKNPTHLFFLL